MIVIQLLAFLLLIPMTFVLFLSFQIFLLNWIALSILIIFDVIYSLLVGLVFLSWNLAIIVFIILIVCYYFRAKSLAKRLHQSCPLIHAQFKNNKNKVKINMMMQLSFLRIVKLLPNSVSQQLSEQLGAHIQVSELIELFLQGAKGTRIDIVTEDVILFFEIQ